MTASYSYSPPKMGGSYHAAEIQKLCRCTMVSSVARFVHSLGLQDQVNGFVHSLGLQDQVNGQKL